MGGSSCTIVNCGACNSTHGGVGRLSFHRIPKAGISKEKDDWRRELIHAVSRQDPWFNPDTATICSRHFEEKCFINPQAKRRKLYVGSLPTKDMPRKSIETQSPAPRKQPVARLPPPVPKRVYYSDLQDVIKDLKKVPVPWTVTKQQGTEVQIGIVEGCFVTTLVSIQADLKVSVFIQGLLISRSFCMEDQRLTSLLESISAIPFCTGVLDDHLQLLAPLPTESSGTYYRHLKCTSTGQMAHSSTVRSKKCTGVSQKGTMCTECDTVKRLLCKRHERASSTKKTDVHSKTPLQTLAKKSLVEALKKTRESVRILRQKQAQISKKLQKESVPVGDDLHDSLKGVVQSQTLKNPFLKLFWEEQLKAYGRTKGGMRWHPMLIRFAILIHAQSAGTYRLLRQTGCLNLPGESTLRDYTNAIHPNVGFNPEVIEEIKKEAASLKANQRWVVLLQDEMAIKQDLVHDLATGDIVGYLDSDRWSLDHPTSKDLASHVLVFMVVGVNSQLKMSMGYFPTRGATSDVLYPLFWRAVALLEVECGLKVIATTCDKASQNQKFIRIHGDGNFCYKTSNIFAPEREIFFVSDTPHLIKTVRNNLWSSKTGGTRYLWNNGQYILWDHITDMYKEDADLELYKLKLTDEHIYLNAHSIMRVNLAAQVMSSSVGKVMADYGGPQKAETANFIQLMDRFFDCLNGRSTSEGDIKIKHDLDPYRSMDDPRFKFLQDEFLGYLSAWKESVMTRPGFSKTDKNRMFLSYQTYEGLQVTVKSIVEATRYLLSHGVDYIRSQVFCQDPLEEHFSRHRALGRRSDNPTLWGFGYQENKLRLQRSIAMQLRPKGNVRGEKRKEEIKVTNSPLKKRKITKP